MASRGGALMVVGLCLLYFQGSVDGSKVKEHNSLHDLTVQLLSVHNRQVIPVTPVNVSYSLSLVSIDGVDEKQNLLKISAFAGIAWSDHRLQWDPANYSGIPFVNLPTNSIWRPDIQLLYGGVAEDDSVPSRVFPDGTVWLFLPMRLDLPCSFDFNDYPFDAHTCDIQVESWTYSTSMLNLILDGGSFAANQVYHRNNSQWEVVSFKAKRVEATYQCCPDDLFANLLFSLHFKRTVGEYEVRAVVPSILLSLLILLCFLIPPLSGGRMVLCSVVILGLLLQLHILNQTVPIRGPDAPFLADFLCFSVFLAFFAAVESVVAMNLSSWGTLTGKSNDKSSTPKDGEAELVAEPKPSLFLMQLARIVDLVCFVVFTVIFAIGGAIILNPKQPE